MTVLFDASDKVTVPRGLSDARKSEQSRPQPKTIKDCIEQKQQRPIIWMEEAAEWREPARGWTLDETRACYLNAPRARTIVGFPRGWFSTMLRKSISRNSQSGGRTPTPITALPVLTDDKEQRRFRNIPIHVSLLPFEQIGRHTYTHPATTNQSLQTMIMHFRPHVQLHK